MADGLCPQNHGRLSARKRASHFDLLLYKEVDLLEQAVGEAYGIGAQDQAQRLRGAAPMSTSFGP